MQYKPLSIEYIMYVYGLWILWLKIYHNYFLPLSRQTAT